jgi:hypothetical protein
MICVLGHTPTLEETEVILGLFIGCTLALNILLASMITAKLMMARRDALTLDKHMKGSMKGSALRYLTLINAIVESAALWILPTMLYLTSFIYCAISVHSLSDLSYFCAVSSSFSYIFAMTSVSCHL